MNRREFLKVLTATPLPLLPGLNANWRKHSANLDQPNILVVVFDALSARHLSLYGYHRRTTPNLSKLAERATVYHKHHSGGNFTIPGTATIFTGVYPSRHQALHLWGAMDAAYHTNNIFQALQSNYYTFAYTHNDFVNILLSQVQRYIDEWTPTHELSLAAFDLAHRFLRNDFHPAVQASQISFAAVPPNPTSSVFFAQINKYYREVIQKKLDKQYKKEFPHGIYFSNASYFILETVINWIANQARTHPQPFFGYVHLYPPHEPYQTRAEYVDKFQDGYVLPAKPLHVFGTEAVEKTLDFSNRRYDETVAYCDAEFGRLFNRLEKAGILDNTLLILTSDHGELFERGIYAHATPVMYESLLHIPLLIWQPGQTSRTDIHALTSNIDLLPTLLHRAHLPIPPSLPGMLLPGMGGAEDPGRVIFAVEAKENQFGAPLNKATITAQQGNLKLIQYRGYKELPDKKVELYDLETDPEELNDISKDLPQECKGLTESIEKEIDNI